MSKENKSTPLKKIFTLVTAPLWVPVAAVGGAVVGAVKGVDKGNDIGKEDGPLVGIAATPFTTVKGIVTGPVKGIIKVGEELWGDDDD